MTDKQNKIFDKIKNFCNEHSLDLNSFDKLLNEPKLVPMLRGIGYEYVVRNNLNELLKNSKRYEIRKPNINAQFSLADIDIEIYDYKKKDSKILECKLAQNNSFRLKSKNKTSPYCKIKVMRSRTLGTEKIKEFSKAEKIPIKQVETHKDSYPYYKFDYVVTNLRNAFYKTKDNIFSFNPSNDEIDYLKKLFKLKNRNEVDEKLKKTNYIISSKMLAPKFSNLKCTKKGCPNPSSCIFIPNYPIFDLKNITWDTLEEFTNNLQS